MNFIKRIMKEYNNIKKEPLEHIIIKINEENLCEINFLIKGHIEPYKNGIYWGILKLPELYPLKPPSIQLKTENGRFHINKDICFSNSNFHIENWNPSWTIKTILIGFYSFMLENNENDTLGAINTTFEEKEILAKKSLEYNKKILNFEKIFDLQEDLKKNIEKNLNIEEEIKICRFCLENEKIEPLLTLCNCKGSCKYIHMKCIKQWCLYSILNQSTHPSYQKPTDKICNICNSPYKIDTITRSKLMTEITGEEIKNEIKIGNILISPKKKSEDYLKIIEENKNNIDLIDNLKHWIYSIIIIIEINNGIIGININRNINDSNNKSILYSYYKNYINIYNIADIININNMYIGGPCNLNQIYGILIIDKLEEKKLNKDIIILKNIENKILIMSDYINIYNLYIKLKYKNEINIYFGYAGWSNIQLYSEFNKLNWGICDLDINNILKKNYYDLININNILFVKDNIYSNN